MARVFVTALSAVTIIGLGIVALQFRAQDLANEGFTGANATALNLTNAVGGDAMTIVAHAIPWLMIAVIAAFLFVVLLMNR